MQDIKMLRYLALGKAVPEHTHKKHPDLPYGHLF